MTPSLKSDIQFTSAEIKDFFEFMGKVNESLNNIRLSQEKLESNQTKLTQSTDKLLECIHSQEKAFIEFKTETKAIMRNRALIWSSIISLVPITVSILLAIF